MCFCPLKGSTKGDGERDFFNPSPPMHKPCIEFHVNFIFCSCLKAIFAPKTTYSSCNLILFFQLCENRLRNCIQEIMHFRTTLNFELYFHLPTIGKNVNCAYKL